MDALYVIIFPQTLIFLKIVLSFSFLLPFHHLSTAAGYHKSCCLPSLGMVHWPQFSPIVALGLGIQTDIQGRFYLVAKVLICKALRLFMRLHRRKEGNTERSSKRLLSLMPFIPTFHINFFPNYVLFPCSNFSFYLGYFELDFCNWFSWQDILTIGLFLLKFLFWKSMNNNGTKTQSVDVLHNIMWSKE